MLIANNFPLIPEQKLKKKNLALSLLQKINLK